MTTIKLFLLTLIIIPNILFAQFTQQGSKLVGTGSVGNSLQGCAVAISDDGNTAVVGGTYDNTNLGAVWVYVRNGGTWTQQGQKLVGSGASANSWQGYSVAISGDGNTIAISGTRDINYSGGIWIFTRTAGVWTQQGNKLFGTGATGNASQGSFLSLSSDGNTLVSGGASDNLGAGAFWVFTRSAGVWTQQGSKLVGTGAVGAAGQGFAVSISSDGNTIVESGHLDNNHAGAIWVFTRTAGVWTQLGTKLTGSGAVGDAYQGETVDISGDGNTIIEGSAYDNNNFGAAWVFTRNGGVWTQQGLKLLVTGNTGVSQQGIVSISADGNIAIIGGLYDNTATGACWVFTRSGGTWTQLGSKFTGTGAIGAAYQGITLAVSADGNTVIEGGPFDNSQLGAVWIFSGQSIGITPISNETPDEFSLSQNYPNPFNPNSKIKFRIAKSGAVKLIVFDELGREVSILVNEELKPGTYEADFDGSKLTSGVYFYKLETGGFVETKKMLMIK